MMCIPFAQNSLPTLCAIVVGLVVLTGAIPTGFASESDGDSQADEIEDTAAAETPDDTDTDTDAEPTVTEESTAPPALDDTARAELADMTQRLRRQAQGLRQSAGATQPLQPDDLLRQIPGSSNPSNIFNWMKQNIDYEPYTGSLRGASGTIIAEAANAADQALLANELLESAGHQTRFVTGQLHEQDAARVLEQTLGTSTLLTAPESPVTSSSHDSSLAYSSALHTMRDHIWVEVVGDEDARPFDPLASPTYGMTVATPQKRHEDFPDQHQTQFEMRLVSELDDGQTVEHFVVEGPLSRVAFRAMTLSFEDDPMRTRGHRPTLSVEGDTVRGDTIPVAALESLELRFRFQSARHENRWNQVLYRRGYGIDIFDFEHQHFAFTVAPGWTSKAKLRQVADQAAEGALESIEDWVDKESETPGGLDDEARRQQINGVLDHLGASLPFAFARTLDRATDDISEQLGVYPILGRPRVLTTGLLRQGEDFHIDLQVDGDRIEALPRIGIPGLATTAFVAIHGLFRDHLVSELLETYGDHRTTTVRRVFDEAANQSIPFTTITAQDLGRLDRLAIEPSTREMMLRQLRRRNMTILAPLEPIDDDGVKRFAWWAVNPHYGNLEGHTSDAILAVGVRDEAQELSLQPLIEAHLELIGRHFSAAYHATSDEDRFPELVCSASRQFQRLSRAFCATSERMPRPDIATCLDNKPVSGGNLLSLSEIDCADHFAPFRCAAAYSTELLEGHLRVSADDDPTPIDAPRPLCY